MNSHVQNNLMQSSLGVAQEAHDVGSFTQGTNQSGMRAQNEKLVLTLIRRYGALPKAEIAKRTGLSAQTASVIIRALETDGLLLKGQPQRGRVGQPSVPIALDPDGAFFFGLKVGRRSAELVLIDFLGQVRGLQRLFYAFPTADSIVAFALRAAGELSAKLGPGLSRCIVGMGIAIPFDLWSWAQVIGVAPQAMAHWQDRNIARELEAHFDFPIFVQNDASAACGAQLTFGQGKGEQGCPSNFLYIYFGYFIGAGMVLGNRLYTGPTGNAAVMGPMPVRNLQGETVQLINTSSIAGLERRMREAGDDVEGIWQDPNAWRVDADVLHDWITEASFGLAQAIVATLAVVDFEAILIDGSMPRSVVDSMVAATRQAFELMDRKGLSITRIQAGTVGPMARALGAASLPLANRYLLE